jgi:HD-GYP domain-containing protein (c-di-GMP phosphodiesterase class II)
MNKFPVEKLKPGMRFTLPVYMDQNNMLVGANVPLKEGDIKRLQKWGMKEILTDGVPTEAAPVVFSPIEGEGADLGQIFTDYTNLIRMRDEIARVHLDAYNAVQKAHLAVRNNRLFVTTELEKSAEEIISILMKNKNAFLFMYDSTEEKDSLASHSVNVTFYAVLIGLTMKFPKVKLIELALGTLMINIGMVQIPVYITHKQSSLTDHELNQVKTHPILAYQAMKKYGNFAEKSALVSLQHHEQYDGKGYPRGLKGIEIDECSRIAAVADNYEALLGRRSYREKQFFYQAMKQLVASGARKFDPVILKIFISVLSVYPVGSIVEVNKGGIGIVIGSNIQRPMRPIVKMVRNEDGQPIRDLILVNLSTDQTLFITKTLDEKEAGISVTDVL